MTKNIKDEIYSKYETDRPISILELEINYTETAYFCVCDEHIDIFVESDMGIYHEDSYSTLDEAYNYIRNRT